jgi:DNA-binding CsgD family transcriptional regulator
MSDDDAFDRFLIQPSEGYARLYPSILRRLRQAYESGNPTVKQAVLAMAAALARAEGRRERRLRDDYSLTPTEVRVALHLIDGGTVASCAEAMDVAQSTVRSHLKSVFAKTGVNRQAQLSKMLRAG